MDRTQTVSETPGLVDPYDPSVVDEIPARRRELQHKAQELADQVPNEGLIDGKSFRELSLYEKKSVLVNHELDSMGMGRYQWCIFVLCGFGYFLDLAWAQSFGLIVSQIQRELNVPDTDVGQLTTAFNTGLTVGAFSWGMLVDILGRRWCFNLTCLVASIFGLLFAAPSNWGALCFFASMVGFGVGGNIPIDAAITLEFLPRNRRFLLAALSTFQPIGVVVTSLIAYGLVPSHSCGDLPPCATGEQPCCTKASNMGWRYTMITLGCITLFIFILRFVVFKFRESPKYLLAKGHDMHALDVLYSVAKFNRREPPSLTLEDFAALDFEDQQTQTTTSETPLTAPPEKASKSPRLVLRRMLKKGFGHLVQLFRNKLYLYLFMVLTLVYMSYFWSFSIAGGFLPLILAAKGVDTSASVADTYRSYVWIYLPGVTACLVASGLMEVSWLGRKWPMVVSAALMGLALALYQTINSRAASIGFNAMEYWFQSLFGSILYAYTPEAFPAPVRGSTSGMLSTLGRIASIVAPLAAGSFYNGGSSPGVLWLAAGAAWLSMLALLALPYDTSKKQAY